MARQSKTLLCLCAALAFGEACGALLPTGFVLWPLALLLALLVMLFGYGLAVPGWRLACVALVGLALFYRASQPREEFLRLKPWMRNAPSMRRLSPDRPTRETASRVRDDLSRRLGIGLEHDRDLANLNRAILLGERRSLPRRTRKLFVEAGTIHIFAISGLHVMIVAKVILFLLLSMLVPLRIAGVCSLPVLWGYVLVIGAPPSAVRAALMASFHFSAFLFWRRPDAIASWALTFLCVHLVRPENIAHVGSLLSFTVMFAILIAARAVRDVLPRGAQGLVISLAAWSAGVPIAAHVFGRVTPGGILANLALIPAATVTVVTGVLGLVASFLSETLAAHLNNASALFTGVMVGLSEIVASLPGANVVTRPWTLVECALWYAVLVAVPWLILRYRRREPF